VTCVFQHRFAPLAECLKSALDAGDFGAVLRGEFRFACTRNRAYYSREAWRGRWPTEGGGLLINQAIHGLDLALWFCGRPRRVEATVGCLRMSDCIEVEDVARGTVFCEGDIPVVVDAINDGETGWSNTVIIEAEKGSFTYTNDGGGRLLAIEHADAGLVARLEGLDASRQEVTALGGKSEYGNYHLKQLSELIDAIEAGRPPRVTIAEGAWANRAVLGFYHATAIGGPADLSTFAADYQQPDLLSQAVPH
jgi:predicted dehydrogenase